MWACLQTCLILSAQGKNEELPVFKIQYISPKPTFPMKVLKWKS